VLPALGRERRTADARTAVRAGDTLDVSVFNQAELSRVVQVQPDGSISLPFIGTLRAEGRTGDAIGAEVAAMLGEKYSLKDPRVSVNFSAFAARSVYVMGRVRQSGVYAIPQNRPLTLLQAIAQAGGFEEDADPSRVEVRRMAPDGAPTAIRVDLTGVERDGSFENDVALEDGDTVFVPQFDEVRVLGQVNRPGSFFPRAGKPLTLLGAISRAEGFTRLAKPSATVWIRKAAGGVRTVSVDVDGILAGAGGDPVLEPGDVVFVPERTW
jgi:polysaccharide export outer membrane protein